jgi:hypothetical protein
MSSTPGVGRPPDQWLPSYGSFYFLGRGQAVTYNAIHGGLIMHKQLAMRHQRWLVPGLTMMVLFALLLVTARAQVSPTETTIPAPNLTSPADGAETTGNPEDPDVANRELYAPLGIPTFRWQDVGAGKYELEVATTLGFGADVIMLISDLRYPTFTPNGNGEHTPGFSLTEDVLGNFSDEATFYWHVRAWDNETDAWSDYSPTWQFTRHWGYRPQLLEPIDNSIEDLTPQFKWDPVPGASFYELQVDTSNSFGSPSLDVTTDVPAYAPPAHLANDDDLFWRVRAFHRPNNTYGGPWSEVRQFKLAWSSKIGVDDKRPLLLIPPNNANYINRPLYCWQPVAGARQYRVEMATHPEFVAGSVVFSTVTKTTCYAFPKNGTYKLELGAKYYWRVTAIEDDGHPGQSTDFGGNAYLFTVSPSDPPVVPTLFYPPYYYDPLMPDTFEDRTMALPTFMWDHIQDADSYELCIDDNDPLDCTGPDAIVVQTANASFTFTDTASYPLQDGQIYYWKVRADVLGAPAWSSMTNRWKTRIDLQQVPVTDSIHLLQPTYQVEGWSNGAKYGQESLTYYPVFAWTAVAPIGEATYRIQIAHDSAFEHVVHDARTEFPEYTPTERPEPGTYYWRVRRSSPVPSDWSEIGRFSITRNFLDIPISVDGSALDWLGAGAPFYAPQGEAADVTGDYNLSGFYVANDSINWYLGVPLASTARLGIYFDTDHFDGEGATAPPAGSGGNPGAVLAHQPEYAVYWYWSGSPEGTSEVFAWDGAQWDSQGSLTQISGDAVYSDTIGFLELAIPVGNLSTFYYKGSLSISMFTLDGSDAVQDRLPNVPGQPAQPAFLTESTTPTPLLPANAPSNPALAKIEHNTPVLTWRHNEFSGGTYFFQTFEDDTLTNLYESENGNSPIRELFYDSYTHWAPIVHYSDNNSYNWTIQRGGYTESAPNHFRKAGYIPTDLRFSPIIVSDTLTYTNRTPTFGWQPAQSAPRYLWVLYAGGNQVASKKTPLPYYTPQSAIADGTYTWKVWAEDAEGRKTAEAAQGEFRKVSDPVQLLPAQFEENLLVLRWEPAPFAAYYKVMIADDPGFSKATSIETYNATLTPKSIPSQTADGVFFVRVIPYDQRGHPGTWRDLQFGRYLFLPVVLR